MTHNPNSQDEMAAEKFLADKYPTTRSPDAFYGFIAGCKYKAEQLAKAEELIKQLKMHLKHIGMATRPGDNGERTYLMNDDAYIMKQIEKALAEIDKYRKGEG